jgi:hypothetical protein
VAHVAASDSAVANGWVGCRPSPCWCVGTSLVHSDFSCSSHDGFLSMS